MRDVVSELGLIPEDRIDDALDVRQMTERGLPEADQ